MEPDTGYAHLESASCYKRPLRNMSHSIHPVEPSDATSTPYPQTASDKKLNELGYDMLSEHRQAVAMAGLLILTE